MELTPRESQILDCILKHLEDKGYPPSVREIGKATGLRSPATVLSYLRRLEDRGFLRRDQTASRAVSVGPRLRAVAVPLLGRIAAGQPHPAVEYREDVLLLPAELTGSGECFALRVRGESMVEAGILDGDLVVVRRQPTAENGDIVAALVAGEATVKRFYREDGRIRLQPENRTMRPIFTDEAAILGKVVALIRKCS
ncbi:SOS-response transcriptional repressor, LexA [Candidatus Desulforudis audaxviator MP104C]|uniref:LexA repressor n=2 Tax=Thermoanaerobacterales TaxID=68295 RepID=B1I2R5_DESAP|nr:transcriptional repressor LexA [Candidatus Desulforudis audaxviator]ACA59281.1 SOS-response transcriptional repressor, LexA [Candidatus Desulforudis audaxviator MP104C]